MPWTRVDAQSGFTGELTPEELFNRIAGGPRCAILDCRSIIRIGLLALELHLAIVWRYLWAITYTSMLKTLEAYMVRNCMLLTPLTKAFGW